jgi:hypothetical protein
MSIHLHIVKLMSRDVTDHLQLLLRKSGYYLHTSAEKEVVRTIKEKTCYLALNPQKEEKDQVGAWEEFRLPDGKVMRVCPLFSVYAHTDDSSGTNGSWRPRSYSTQNSSDKKIQVFIRYAPASL